jgi:mono/diheme cytochrome c family protein
MNRLWIILILIAFATPTITFADGKPDYDAKCTLCHGGDARTNTKRAKMLNVDPTKLYLPASPMSKAEMIVIIEKGRNKMPSFENQLTKDQIIAIVDYIKSLGRK